MGVRGRRSLSSLSVVSNVVSIPRPAPPDELTDEQSGVWRTVTDRMPADWFGPENYPLLAHYCRHVVTARRVAQLIERAEAEDELDVAAYDKLLVMQSREGAAMSSLATRMRLSQQSSYRADKAKPKNIAVKPWDVS